MKHDSQYQRIISALRKAGKRGLTTAELALAVGSNCVWRRVSELATWQHVGNGVYYIDRSSRLINSRHVRVYRLVRV